MIDLRGFAIGLALVAAVPGCGSSDRIRVSGKVVKGGAAFACPSDRPGCRLCARHIK